MARPLTILISGAGIAGPTLAYWLVRRGHRPVLVERTRELRVGGHAVDVRGTALEVVERMGLDAAVRDARAPRLTRQRRSNCGKTSFGPMSNSTRPWRPTGCRRCCPRRGWVSPCATRR